MFSKKGFKEYKKLTNFFSSKYRFKRNCGLTKEELRLGDKELYDFLDLFTFTKKDSVLVENYKEEYNENGVLLKNFIFKETKNSFLYAINGTSDKISFSVVVKNKKIPFFNFLKRKFKDTKYQYFLYDIDVFAMNKELEEGDNVVFMLSELDNYLPMLSSYVDNLNNRDKLEDEVKIIFKNSYLKSVNSKKLFYKELKKINLEKKSIKKPLLENNFI